MSRDGDTSVEAWAAEVLRANGMDLLSYLARRTPVPEDAADVLGHVMIVAWKRRASIPRSEDQARMWTFGVARNALREYRRRGVRQSKLAERLRANILAEDGEDSDPAEAAAHADRTQEVRAAVAALPEHDRELIILIHWDEFSIAQAAKLLRINASTARSRYSRARAQLAARLEGHRPTNPTTAPDCAAPRRESG